MTLYLSFSPLSLFIYFPTCLISQGTYSYAYSPSYTTNTLTALGLKTQFSSICASIPKTSETLQHTKLFSVLVSVMEPGATHARRCSPRAHLGSSFKECTCNWGHRNYSWMNDGLLGQSQPLTPSTWDGYRNGYRTYSAKNMRISMFELIVWTSKQAFVFRNMLGHVFIDLSGHQGSVPEKPLNQKRTEFKAANINGFFHYSLF